MDRGKAEMLKKIANEKIPLGEVEIEVMKKMLELGQINKKDLKKLKE